MWVDPLLAPNSTSGSRWTGAGARARGDKSLVDREGETVLDVLRDTDEATGTGEERDGTLVFLIVRGGYFPFFRFFASNVTLLWPPHFKKIRGLANPPCLLCTPHFLEILMAKSINSAYIGPKIPFLGFFFKKSEHITS